MGRIKNKYILSTLTGVLLFLAFPFTGSVTPLIFLALVPLLYVENELKDAQKSFWRILKFSWISFLIYNIGATWWIWNASEGGAIFAIVLNALLMAIFFSIYHFFNKKINSKYSNFYLIPVWISFEYFHYHWELSWPWLNFGNVFSIQIKWVQWYEYTGVLGGTFWVLLINILIFKILSSDLRLKKGIVYLSGLLVIPFIYSFYKYYTFEELGEEKEIVLLQPNIDPYTEKFSSDIYSQMDKMYLLADSLITPQTDLIVAPETAISQTFWENNFQQTSLYNSIISKVDFWGIPFLTGASTLKFYESKKSSVSRPLSDGPGFYESYNTSVLFEMNKTPKYIHKSKLVLGVEKIPFNTLFPWLENLALNFGGASGSLGIEDSVKTFSTKNLKIAATVCYESVYGDFVASQVLKDAGFIAILTNDGWWGDTPGYKQHASFARLRAIENRRSVVRSANTGTSCVINQRGDILHQTPYWVESGINAKIKMNNNLTLYSSFGDYLGWLAVFSFVLIILIFIYRRQKK